MFRPGTLSYVTTLPRPMPLVDCVSASGDAAVVGEKKNSSAKSGAVYPDAIGTGVCLRTRTCAIVYSDRSIVVWDIAGRGGNGDRVLIDPKKAQVHRAFQFHSDCTVSYTHLTLPTIYSV